MANFYMKKVGEDTEYNIENHWNGLLYKQFKGLSDYGKIKSVYTESFAETLGRNHYKSTKGNQTAFIGIRGNKPHGSHAARLIQPFV